MYPMVILNSLKLTYFLAISYVYLASDCMSFSNFIPTSHPHFLFPSLIETYFLNILILMFFVCVSMSLKVLDKFLVCPCVSPHVT